MKNIIKKLKDTFNSVLKNKKGFTLMEMLVVVLIIGILAGIALPKYEVAVEKSRVAEAISLIAPLMEGIDVYALSHDKQYVEFIGKMGMEGGELDIDVESVLDCTLDSEGDRCFSKNFSFDAYCDDGCFISAYRQNSENDSQKYSLSLEKTDNGWEKLCQDLGTDIGVKICKSLEGQGWRYI